jgi:plastocyanin
VNIVGQRGNTSFSPNPVTASSTQTAVWTNADSVIHRIVANDGTFDTGNIAPGASSAAIPIPGTGDELSLLDSPGDGRCGQEFWR